METKKITCPHCKSQICTEVELENNTLKIWNCFGCGFTSNSTLTDENFVQVEEVIPELYKDLKFKDENGFHWYPTSVILDDKSMVFAEGNSVDNWKWSAVQAKDGKADMTTKKEFEQNEFVYALEYIDYFSKS